MYTQCVKCETVFRLAAETLRAAGGQVRCGRCGEVFNALARLAEEPGAFPSAESAIDMEARADEILGLAVPTTQPRRLPPERHDEGVQVVGKFAENRAPAASPAPIPAVTTPRIPTQAAAPRAAPAAPLAPRVAPAAPVQSSKIGEEAVDDGSLEFTLPPGELDRVFVERAVKPSPPAATASLASPTPRVPPAPPPPDPPPPDPRPAGGAGFEISEDVRREMLSGLPDAETAALLDLTDLSAPAPPAWQFNLWLAAAVSLALLLGVQWIHGNRDWLATHAPGRGALHGLYAAVGIATAAPPNLSSYQLRQWGVTGEPGASGMLRVRASILNTAAQLQPYPLLRVTLANRFGAKLGSRDFEPAEYMGKPIVRMLAPGERADATLDIVDPGKDAEGFEIDVCLRGADQKLSCAGDVAARPTAAGP